MKKHSIDISVIIPAYNAESTIEKTLNSVIVAIGKRKNIEIVIVDDGSVDLTYMKCMIYKENFDYIKVIHTDNKGVSHARNMGIRAAEGEYLLFVDADDLIMEQLVQRMLETIEYQKSDLVCCGYVRKNNSNTDNFCLKNALFDYNQFMDYWAKLEIENNTIAGSVWAKLFLREIIIQFEIVFPVGMSYGEDFYFLAEYCKYINNVICIEEPLYCYQMQAKSLVTNLNLDTIKSYTNLFLIKQRVFCKYVETIKWINTLYIENMLTLFGTIEKRKEELPCCKYIKKELLENEIIKEVLLEDKYYKRSWYIRIVAFLYLRKCKCLLKICGVLKSRKMV